MEIEELKDLAIALDITKNIVASCGNCEDCIIGLIKYKYSQDNLKAILEAKRINSTEINRIINTEIKISEEQQRAINSLDVIEIEIEDENGIDR